MFKTKLIVALSLSSLLSFSFAGIHFVTAADGNSKEPEVFSGNMQTSLTVSPPPSATSSSSTSAAISKISSQSEQRQLEDGGRQASSKADLEAASSAYFRGDYQLAKKHCFNFLKHKDGKRSAQTPEEIESITANHEMAFAARVCINLGMCELGLKEPDKARRWFEHAQKLLDKINDPAALDIGDCLTGLGECHYMQGQAKLALRDYSEAITFYQQKLGRFHPDTIPALEGLAGTHYEQGDYKTALPLYEQIARIDLAQFGPEHPRVGFSLNSIAEVYYKLNGCTSSREHFEQGIWIFKKNNADRLLAKLQAESSGIDDTKLATMRQRVLDSIMGTRELPDIPAISYELLKSNDFDPKNQQFKLRADDFDNWRVFRDSVEETLFISIDPKVEQKGMILCLHGLGLHATSFRDFATKINSTGYGVMALDVRGFGSFAMEKGLDKVDLNAGLEDLAAVLSLVKSHNPNLPIAVLGESMGGALALQLAAKYPKNVSALISAVPSGKRYKAAATQLLVGFKLLEDKKKPIEIGKKIVQQSSSDEGVREVWLNDPNARLKLSAQELVRFQEFMNQTAKSAKDINEMPVIIFQGFRDHLVKAEGTIALYGALSTRQKDLIMVGDAEHLIFEEGQAPADIVRMLAAWLDSHIGPDADQPKSTAANEHGSSR
jgi:alpha-beta hydrolase superfamily lysophospholipase/tetratricopeptide (TPR) repeat protein